MHDGHERETEDDDRTKRNLMKSKRFFDTKKSPDAIKHLQQRMNERSVRTVFSGIDFKGAIVLVYVHSSR